MPPSRCRILAWWLEHPIQMMLTSYLWKTFWQTMEQHAWRHPTTTALRLSPIRPLLNIWITTSRSATTLESSAQMFCHMPGDVPRAFKHWKIDQHDNEVQVLTATAGLYLLREQSNNSQKIALWNKVVDTSTWPGRESWSKDFKS